MAPYWIVAPYVLQTAVFLKWPISCQFVIQSAVSQIYVLDSGIFVVCGLLWLVTCTVYCSGVNGVIFTVCYISVCWRNVNLNNCCMSVLFI